MAKTLLCRLGTISYWKDLETVQEFPLCSVGVPPTQAIRGLVETPKHP
ncbi:MAG: hypothetical protein NZ874_06285 [Fimbriimonadales bacterium]|nr:hypothetical protein [Fimbriimonadales bacterium]